MSQEGFTVEPFVDAGEAAKFLSLPTARVLRLARQGALPAHPIGNQRRIWRFRLSELGEWLASTTNRESSFRHAPVRGKSVTASSFRLK
jgi:excisionase family DNA binding protein